MVLVPMTLIATNRSAELGPFTALIIQRITVKDRNSMENIKSIMKSPRLSEVFFLTYYHLGMQWILLQGNALKA